MEKRKIAQISIIIIGIIIIAAVSIILITSNKEKTPIVVSKPINETVNLEKVFDKIETLEGMDVEIVEENRKDETEIDFKEYDVLEKKAIIYTTDEAVNEVWMVKLGDYNQQEDVCRIFGNRVQKLKSAFEGNDEQISILQNAVIKQENGIVVMILSPYAKTIEETIANEM